MKVIDHSNITQIDYLKRLQRQLATYTEKFINEDGSITEQEIHNPYFLVNDTWSIKFISTISNFQDQYQKYNNLSQNLSFNINSPSANLEMKFVWYNKLFRDEWNLNSFFIGQAPYLRKLTAFLNEKYSSLYSLLELDVDRLEREWLIWLEKNGFKTQTTRKDKLYGDLTYKSHSATFLRLMYNSLFELTDTREEWEKDCWDVRILNEQYVIKYNKSKQNFSIDFSNIKNIPIKNEVKSYIKQRLLSKHNFTWCTAMNYIRFLPNFLNFISSIEPSWNNISGLSRKHIERFIEWLNQYARSHLKRRNAHPESYISTSLTIISKFLSDIQRYEFAIAPKQSVRKLIFPEDKPKSKKKSYDHVNYIPQSILKQLFENLNHLHQDFQPVIWTAFKTGLRISDVLGLKQDCLVKLNKKYYIETDIEKTYVKGHRIPIDEELANMLASLIDRSVQNSNQDNNPDRFIFVRYRGSRKGLPYGQQTIGKYLNILANEQNIVDENGQIFYFKTHQFRHTYAVKMLNSGVDILTVQELLAHASPEMTMRYARLLDDTKRKSFENAIEQGVFSFDLNGKMYEISDKDEVPQDILDTLWRDHKLTAIDNPYGSCRARLNGDCPYAEEPPCLTCNGGNPCKDLAVGFSEMDAAKYEIHIQSTSKMIDVAQQYGRKEILEKNRKNLERLKDIYNTIKQGNIIFGRLERIKRKQGVTND
ncbi:tyrosine-type recombinase/integrase [Chengkuizengella sediminis]|uniref:tyrosine-type recombinase/integrase n=1 Tax=Chengkuizengella sediminis TaxID=1885917 RepID=UPI001389FCE9|nr:tyrosine-type recombinase/integrase [Chengkuizengella sediminis]NDI33228.1 tyrosine-type recombinase/integrase [Chengkuizengella sediminis]